MLARACGSIARPAGVRRTLRGSRSSSGPPTSRSSAWNWCERPGCVTCSVSAARVKDPSSTTATKYSSCRRVTAMRAAYQCKKIYLLDIWAGSAQACPVRTSHNSKGFCTMSSEITLARAEKAIEAGKVEGAELGIPFTIPIVDAGAYAVAVSRLDGAALASVELSQAKARTSVLFAQPTVNLVGAVQPGAPLFGIQDGTRDPLAFLPGGIPVIDPSR